MMNGLDTLYGNEWIVANQNYLRIPISEDGVYAIRYEDLQAQNWPVNSIAATDFQLFHQGELVTLYNSNESEVALSNGDFLLFYGNKNTGEVDKHLFRDADQMQLNPEYSLFSDTAAYFLTYQSSSTNQSFFTTIDNDLTNLPNAEPFVWKNAQLTHSDHFMKEYYRISGATLYYSHFGIGEGYGSRSINELLGDGSTTQTYVLDLPNAYVGGPQPILETRYVGALFNHIQQLSINETELRVDTFYNWGLMNLSENLPADVLIEGEARVQWDGLAGLKDEVSVGFLKIKYPVEPNASNTTAFEGIVSANGQRQYLEINNFNASSAIVYDMTNAWRIPVDIEDGVLRVVLPAASTEDRQIRVITSENNVEPVSLSPANLTIPNTNGAQYIILTNSLLRSDGDPVQAYADYRSSISGGSYTTSVVNVDDLFNQFGYGINQHPLGVRNFVAWQRKINPDFKYLFIVGKGREYIDLRSETDLEEAYGSTFFVPSFGYPASDNLLVSDIDKPTPLVSIGRLPAINASEVSLYLNKISSLEAQTDAEQTIEARAWMKNVIHLGGGSSPSEQQTIKNNLQGIGSELEKGMFGAQITSFYKTSTDPIETSLTDQIFNRINEGVSVLTFFGHSSAGTFDFNIDNPDNYENAPKYPLMLSLGCYSGNMYADFRSIGERFVFLEDGGAGVFGASRGLGFIHSLNAFAKDFYKQMSNDYYGEPIGDGVRASIGNFEHLTDQAYGTLMEQFSLQGDPGFRLNPSPGPDYTFANDKTVFEPSIISAQKDSFQVTFTLQNIGKGIEDSLELSIRRILPSGEIESLHPLKIPAPTYDIDVTIKLPTQGKNGVGLNRFLVTANSALIDPIEELPNPSARMNNILISANGEEGIPFFIIDNTALPVWPPNYALVGEPNVVLKASTADALAPERTYYMELDTTPKFDQPLASTTIVQTGGVIRWNPAYTWQDSTVYYWRITPDSTDIGTANYVWESSSFTFVDGISPGWGQGHWGQYAENELENIEVEEREQLDFVENVGDLTIRNIIYTIGGTSDTRPRGFVNGNRWTDFFRWDVRPSLQVVVIDSAGVFLRNESPGQYGSVNTSTPNAIACFSFPLQTSEQRGNIINFLTNIVPDNHTVIIYNAIRTETQDLWINEWASDSLNVGDQNLFNVLENAGATQVRELLEGPMRPYFFSFIKGSGILDEKIAEDINEILVYSINLPGRWTHGEMNTYRIGPASGEWGDLLWATPPQSINDTIRVQLFGVQTDGVEVALMDSVAMNGQLDLSAYSSSEYPYMKLNFYGEDRIDKSCPPLKYWHIHHQGLPDLALDSHLDYAFYADSLLLGEEMRFRVAVSNISNLPIDSTTALFSIQSTGQEAEEWEEPIPALTAEEHFVLTTSKSSADWSGNTQLQVTINAPDAPKERLRINNQAVKDILVINEEIDPVVDIVFDGQQILNGDLVSAKPFVQIQIEDENPFLLLNDSSLFTVRLRDPLGSEKNISLDGVEAQFFPATMADNNVAKIEWQPDFTSINGEYVLTVRARDQIGNEPRLLHEISFEVIKEQMLGNVLPYPNPFTSSTRFVYTLTGVESPSQYKIQIMTISGRIVREINQYELGPLKIGTHMTDFIWDGTDTYGDHLAIGTYLYRVVAVDEEGNNLEHYDTGTDAFFKNRVGKIVLLK